MQSHGLKAIAQCPINEPSRFLTKDDPCFTEWLGDWNESKVDESGKPSMDWKARGLYTTNGGVTPSCASSPEVSASAPGPWPHQAELHPTGAKQGRAA